MPNQITKLQDVIVPELFTQYAIDRTAELSRLVESGIVTANPLLNELVTGGGKTIEMPSWNDLSGESQVMDEDNPILADKITSKKDTAVLQIRAKAWAAHELAGALAGSDPMAAIVQLVARWWTRDEQRILMATLKGIFASASMSGLIADFSAVGIKPSVVLDAKQKLGDAADQLTAIAMHSATYTELQKQQLIVFIPNARGEVVIPTYLTYRVIVDDGMPVDTTTGVHTSYLFAGGVIARGDGTPASLTPTEVDRDTAMSTDYLFNRRAFVLHPMGVMWTGTDFNAKIAAGTAPPFPRNEDLANGANWNRVADVKKIGIVKLTHKLTD